MANKKDLTRGDIFPHIVKMALPMFLGLIAHMFLLMVDAMYVSNLGTDASMAVLNYGFPLFYLPFALFNGLNAGTSAIIAQLIGAKKIELANNTLMQTIIVSISLFLIILLIFPFAMSGYLNFLNVPESIRHLTTGYATIVMFGFVFTSITLILGGALRAEGNMRTLSMAMFLGTVINIFLDPILIFDNFTFLSMNIVGLGFGVKGAAYATVISNVASASLILKYFLQKKSILKWPIKPNWNKIDDLKKVFKVSVPAAVSQSMLGIGVTVLTYLATPFGRNAIAGIGIGMRLDILAVFPSLAVMTAVVSLVGQNYGAKNLVRVKKSLYMGLATVFIFLTSIGWLIFIVRHKLIALFDPVAKTAESAGHYVACLSMSFGFIGISMVSGGAFQGLGRGLPSMYITIFRILVVNFSLSWFLSTQTSLGERGLHYAPMITNMLMGSITTLWVLRAVNKLKFSEQNA